jgi:glycosyltransferase involved in cell wall biosynthesis
MRTALRRFARALGRRSGDGAPSLYYVVPGVNWVLDEVGRSVTTEIQKQFGLRAQIVESTKGLRGQILHYGSLWDVGAYLQSTKNVSNTVVGTIFHGQKQEPAFHNALNALLAHQERFAKLHTACRIMEERLLNWGVPREKLVMIPIGVDLNNFVPVTPQARVNKRAELGIPEDAFCIGSFHKDGQGMDEGLEPKLIKGPDVLLKVVAELHKRHKIFVLLSAPARGYVKRGLDSLGVAYKHIRFDDPLQVATLYPALDAYLLASREEGGPKGVLEALACGIPFVGTRVGLVPDVVTNGKDGLLTESEDVFGLVSHIEQLISDPNLGGTLAQQGLQTIQAYSWPLIAARYYQEIYAPLLATT